MSSRVDGRLDLRNLRAPDSVIVGRYKTARANVKQLGNLVQIKGGRWKDIDFSGGYFRSLRFFDGEIENCCFDGANCQDWRMGDEHFKYDVPFGRPAAVCLGRDR